MVYRREEIIECHQGLLRSLGMGAEGEVKPQYSLREKKISGNLMLEVCLY